jgi:hypothetical protein
MLHLQQALQVLHELLLLQNQNVTMKQIEGYHLSKKRLLSKIKKNAHKMYGENWFLSLCEKHNFTYPLQPIVSKFHIEKDQFVISAFSDAFDIFTNFLFLTEMKAPDHQLIGTDMLVNNVKFSTLNRNSNSLANLFLWLPMFAGAVDSHIDGFKFNRLDLNSKISSLNGSPEQVLLYTCKTYDTFQNKKDIVSEAFKSFADKTKLYITFHKLVNLNYFYVHNQKYLLKTFNFSNIDLLTLLFIDLPFNPSGKGWASPKTQYNTLMGHGIHFSPNASFSWCSVLGIDAFKHNTYNESFDNYIHVCEKGCFAKIYLPPNMPIGLFVNGQYHCPALATIRTFTETSKRTNLELHSSPLPEFFIICIGKRGVRPTKELILTSKYTLLKSRLL